MPKYKITITEVGTKEQSAGKEWTVIKEIDGKPVYGYTPEITKILPIERVIYEQTLGDDQVDIGDLVRHINRIG